HKQSNCTKNLCKGLFVNEIYNEGNGEPVYDSEVIEHSVRNEEYVTGDIGLMLMVLRNYLTPHGNNRD
ncbi:hypothetical protein TorRG33x02_124910, partial [Trema orientale]